MIRMEIVSRIPIGKEHAVHMETLAAELGVSISTIKKMIREARQQGQYEIASGLEGYWIPENNYDKKVCVRQMRLQAFSRLRSVKPMENSLMVFEGQERLFADDGETEKEIL